MALPDARAERHRGHGWRTAGGFPVVGGSGRRSTEVGGSLPQGAAGVGGRIQASTGRWRYGAVARWDSGGHSGRGLGAEGNGSTAVGGEGGRVYLCNGRVGRRRGSAG